MGKSSTDSIPYTDRIRSWARTHARGGSKRTEEHTLPTANSLTEKNGNKANLDSAAGDHIIDFDRAVVRDGPAPLNNGGNAPKPTSAGTASEAEGSGTVVDQPGDDKKANIAVRFWTTFKMIILHSWINVLLAFVPVGIAVAQIPNMPPAVVFAINAVAIVPLAGLLSHATESVARKLGDTIGALLNVTFGNAVELIIFIIALVKGEIRIVQASLLGSILANLLLILGMSFFLGGLRYREQIYNSTVTQMSACLLSLSVISLVLPTAFHASFASNARSLADSETLKISRGTSVILLLVYVMYLLFQLKSHAYMYESTPQHIIDEESTPGPAAAWLEGSSSDSSSSSDSDSDESSHSRETMSKRVKRAIRRRRKSSVASVETIEEKTRSPSFVPSNPSPVAEGSKSGESSSGLGFFAHPPTRGSEEAVGEETPRRQHKRHKHSKRKSQRREQKTPQPVDSNAGLNVVANPLRDVAPVDHQSGEPRRVDFAATVTNMDGSAESQLADAKWASKMLSFNQVRNFAPPVFTQPAGATMPGGGSVPRVRYGIRRTNSLPDRLNQNQHQARPPGAMLPSQISTRGLVGANVDDGEEHNDDLSRVSSIIMLLISTGLVAACAEFMVDSIDAVTATSGIKETFIGLIILPIVGNAAEHVTAITVAMKNKMDLAIGVAVGSSIQIALFITPLVVILGWIIDQPMTLYFTLFETVCLFVSAFIVNFLVLDGRSNYLEGALLCTTYIIIGVVAFFFPEGKEASDWLGGGEA